VLLVGIAVSLVAGCAARDVGLSRQAAVTYDRIAAANAARRTAERERENAAMREAAAEYPKPTLLFAPREPDEEADGEPGGAAGADPGATHGPPLDGRSLGQVMRGDIKRAPAAVRRGFVHAFAKPENLLVLGIAFGADRIVRHNLDGKIREDVRNDDSSLSETGDLGSVIGNPVLHLGIGAAWYMAAVHKGDARQYEMSKTLLEALAVNNITTMTLKVAMDDESPNGEEWGWPSGHTSSSVCFASVMHEFYGWKAALPLYLLAGYSAATRVEDAEHDLSDIVFGAALGWVVGHSVAKGELPEVAGFTVLPYGGRDASGLMLVKQW
jgi:hypothetical protein